MKNATITAIRYGLNRNFFIGMIAIMGVLITISTDTVVKLLRTPQVLPRGFHIYFLITLVSSESFLPFITICATLPLSGIYVDEIKSKYVQFVVFRAGNTAYLLSRIVSCFICGGTVIISGIAALYFVSYVVFLPFTQGVETVPIETGYEFAAQCCLLFLSGGLWAVIGIAMSALMESKYIAYASPFVIYYLLVILYTRYFPNCFLLNPQEWINPSTYWPAGVWGPSILMIELAILFSLIFVFQAGRRLQKL